MTLFPGGWHHSSATSVQCSEMMTLFLGVATTLQPPRPTWHLITPSPRTNNIQGFFLYLRNCPVWEEKRNSQKRELFSGLFCTDTNFMLIMMSPLFLSLSLYAHHLSQCLCLCLCMPIICTVSHKLTFSAKYLSSLTSNCYGCIRQLQPLLVNNPPMVASLLIYWETIQNSQKINKVKLRYKCWYHVLPRLSGHVSMP